MFLLTAFCLISDGINLSSWLHLRLARRRPDPQRRLFFQRVLAGVTLFGSGGLGGVALAQGLRPPRLREVEVRLDRLPRELDGFRIVQITDLHVGPTIGRPMVEDLVVRCNALGADLVAITGDLVDGSVARLGDAVGLLGRLKSRYGTFFVTGNHEYYSGVDAWLQFLRGIGIRVLRNERVSIGASGASFDLAGVDDANAHRYHPDHGPDVAAAVAGRDEARELVLLAHQPKTIFSAARHGVGLQLSGHTHGGQLWPGTLLVRLVHPYVADLHQHNERTQIYVSRGTGYWGPPMRLGSPSELTLLTLRAAA
jgi:hypothetical protein